MEGRALVVNEARPKPEGSRFGGGDSYGADGGGRSRRRSSGGGGSREPRW